MPKISLEEQQALNQEYAKEVTKLKRRIKGIEKRGYSVSEKVLPKKPKNITRESIEYVKSRDINYVYKHSVYVSPTGTKIKGTQKRQQERSEAAKKGAETKRMKYYQSRSGVKYDVGTPPSEADIVIDQTKKMIDSEMLRTIESGINDWTTQDFWSKELGSLKEADKNLLSRALNEAIAESSREQVAKRIQEHAAEVWEIVLRVLYESGSKYHDYGRMGVQQDIQRFAAILKGRMLTVRESMEFSASGAIIGGEVEI